MQYSFVMDSDFYKNYNRKNKALSETTSNISTNMMPVDMFHNLEYNDYFWDSVAEYQIIKSNILVFRYVIPNVP